MSKYRKALEDSYKIDLVESECLEAIEEAIEKAEKYDFVDDLVKLDTYNQLDFDGLVKLKQERDEALKRIDELEQQNKVLVDGVKDLKSYIYIFVDNEINKVIVRLNENKDFVPDEIQIGKKFNEIKAMLEVVENGK